jgi:hypothetical protein
MNRQLTTMVLAGVISSVIAGLILREIFKQQGA